MDNPVISFCSLWHLLCVLPHRNGAEKVEGTGSEESQVANESEKDKGSESDDYLELMCEPPKLGHSKFASASTISSQIPRGWILILNIVTVKDNESMDHA